MCWDELCCSIFRSGLSGLVSCEGGTKRYLINRERKSGIIISKICKEEKRETRVNSYNQNFK